MSNEIAIAGADLRRAHRINEERPHHAPHQGPVGQRCNTELPPPKHAPANNENVIDERPKRRQQKKTMGEQDGRYHSADIEEYLRRQ